MRENIAIDPLLVEETKDYTEYKKLLLDVKRKITNAPSIPDMVRKNIKNAGKYIYFCPPITEEDTNDIDTIMNEVKQWFDGYFIKRQVKIKQVVN